MKKLVFISFFSLSLLGFESRGNISVEYNKFYSPVSTSKALRGDFELKQGGFLFSIKAIHDSRDIKRRYIDVEELYYTKSFDDFDIGFGKSIKFWGALELHNLTDIFNSKDILDDISDEEKKLGSWNVTFTR